MTRLLHYLLVAASFASLPAAASAQISLTTAVDLALRNSPRVHLAQDDVARALAGLQESRDVYIPTLVGGSGLGYSYGFPLGQPTLFNFQTQSLVFSYAQRDYIRAARAGLEAANLTLMDVRQAVAEEAVTTYIALDTDILREAAIDQQRVFSTRLVRIVQDRVDAGQDTPIDLTVSRISDAQIGLALLHAQDETAIDRAHLARLVGMPSTMLTTVSSSIPSLEPPHVPGSPTSDSDASSNQINALPVSGVEFPSLAASYANVRAKREQAFGDSRYLFRPQIAFAAAYSRFSTFNNYQEYYGRRDPTGRALPFQYNAAAFGVQITLPIFDAVHKARARQSAIEATHAQHDADQVRDQLLDARFRLERSTVELSARADIASLNQQLAQQQLDVLLIQLSTPQGDGPQMTPKEEQNSRIAERQKYLALLDARAQMRSAEVNLLRQTGRLESWLKGIAQSQGQTPGQAQSQTAIPAAP